MKCLSLIVFAAIVACGFAAACKRYTVHVSNSKQLADALKNARPGADIKLAPGSYKGSYTVTRSGEPDCEIKIDGNNAATLTSTDKWVFSFNNVSNIMLMNVEISHVSDYGVIIMGCQQNVGVYGVSFSDIDYTAIMITDSNWSNVGECKFNNIRHSCVWIGLDTLSTDNYVEDCQFQDGLSGEMIILDSGAVNNQIRDNDFSGRDNSWSCWVHVKGSNNLVLDNYFAYQGQNPKFAEGVYCAGNANMYRRNSMGINDGKGKYGFYNEGTDERICLTNAVSGAELTNKDYDKSC